MQIYDNRDGKLAKLELDMAEQEEEMCMFDLQHAVSAADNAFKQMSPLEYFQFLVPKGADLNERDATTGHTKLHLATIIGEANTARLLIRAGADVFCVNDKLYYGEIPLSFAVKHQQLELCKIHLTTAPSIIPILKTILLCGNRIQITLPKVVFLNCLAPYIIFNETEKQLALVTKLLALSQSHIAKVPELKRLLDPKNIEQHRAPITKELYASIGITLVEDKK